MFFSIITRQAIRRGSFDNVKELTTAIRAFIAGWNDRCHPFIWTKTADKILPHTRQRIQTQDASPQPRSGEGRNAVRCAGFWPATR